MPLFQSLKETGWLIEVETNGTVYPSKELIEVVDQFNCSPKLENSGNSKKLRAKPFTLIQLISSLKVNFKFVVGTQEDIKEILIVVGFIRDYGNPEIRLMPLSQTKKELLKREPMVKDLCTKHNFIYCTRLSILISGTKRGV